MRGTQCRDNERLLAVQHAAAGAREPLDLRVHDLMPGQLQLRERTCASGTAGTLDGVGKAALQCWQLCRCVACTVFVCVRLRAALPPPDWGSLRRSTELHSKSAHVVSHFGRAGRVRHQPVWGCSSSLSCSRRSDHEKCDTLSLLLLG